MSGKSSRSKGQRGEREVCKLLQPIMDKVTAPYARYFEHLPRAARNLDQTRDGGHDIAGLPFLALEVKRCETVQLNKWWNQAVKQAKGGRIPVLLWRQSRKPWRCRMWATLETSGRYKSKDKLTDAIECVADIELDAFLLWFEEMFREHIKRVVFETWEEVKDQCADDFEFSLDPSNE